MNSTEEFKRESQVRIESSFRRLFHCLDQVSEEQVWWKPDPEMNLIGILVKHICGNLRQWTIIQLTGEDDKRNRPLEFKDDEHFTKKQLSELAGKTLADFKDSINGLNEENVMKFKRIQGYEVTLMTALFRAMTHLEGHIGQIVILTRIQLGKDYKIFWSPQTQEQRSENS